MGVGGPEHVMDGFEVAGGPPGREIVRVHAGHHDDPRPSVGRQPAEQAAAPCVGVRQHDHGIVASGTDQASVPADVRAFRGVHGACAPECMDAHAFAPEDRPRVHVPTGYLHGEAGAHEPQAEFLHEELRSPDGRPEIVGGQQNPPACGRGRDVLSFLRFRPEAVPFLRTQPCLGFGGEVAGELVQPVQEKHGGQGGVFAQAAVEGRFQGIQQGEDFPRAQPTQSGQPRADLGGVRQRRFRRVGGPVLQRAESCLQVVQAGRQPGRKVAPEMQVRNREVRPVPQGRMAAVHSGQVGAALPGGVQKIVQTGKILHGCNAGPGMDRLCRHLREAYSEFLCLQSPPVFLKPFVEEACRHNGSAG
ncbi:hypothetical protein DSECCO2_609020 [anaerobic digester metagenome]